MGLNSKEVSGDHNDQLNWTQTLLSGSDGLELQKARPTRRQLVQLQQPEPLKCPRCESTNTKFCYYNNYNKSQPRHFCKSCKRHWTNGGTLRNIPVGGGRKNKRLKRPSGNTTSAATAAAIQSTNSYLGTYDFSHQEHKTKRLEKKSIDYEKNDSYIEVVDGLDGQNTWDMMSTGGFMGCTMQLPQNPCLGFSVLSSTLSSSFDINLSSILSSSLSSMNGYDKFTADNKLDNTEDSTITTTTMITPSSREPQLILPNSTNGFIEMPSYWNWNVDVDNLVLADLNKPWNDSEFKS